MASRSGSRRTAAGKKKKKAADNGLRDEVILLLVLAVCIILLLSNFNVIGSFGTVVSGVLFGLCGFMAYAAPIVLFLAVLFCIANRGNRVAVIKTVSVAVLFVALMIFAQMISGEKLDTFALRDYYEFAAGEHKGGGAIGGSLAYALYNSIDAAGTYVLLIVVAIVCLVLITERSFLGGVKKGGKTIYHAAKEDNERRRAVREERAAARREQAEKLRLEREEEKRRRMDQKVSGVMPDTTLRKDSVRDDGVLKEGEVHIESHTVPMPADDMKEIILETADAGVEIAGGQGPAKLTDPDSLADFDAQFERIRINTSHPIRPVDTEVDEERAEEADSQQIRDASFAPEDLFTAGEEELKAPAQAAETAESGTARADASEGQNAAQMKKKPTAVKDDRSDIEKDIAGQAAGVGMKREYIFPPVSKLKKGSDGGSGDSVKQLKETAKKLQTTLQNFGVRVTITDISQGPTVTRYEMQPEQGVKVSKIVNLSDDIKLNLAATDIRIEAPIPGKAAVGIEVPNKETSTVMFRDLIESEEFKKFPSKIAFAVGKDIAGKPVVADIGKMPHLLIAGATGSGKSVCINTLIMSILYKAKPDEVKLIMIDPKVVELSVYNGIPHLLIPVVTDPKKAAGALHWGVAEMTDRYQKFADFNVRDLKGYNQKAESMAKKMGDGEEAPKKLPQIIIIVDELADLMMVSPGEVEESICRLAQLARAAGIHLIIATQRPSVDVITGLIKANMPSRVAFSVSSGVDSRTILDMNGAEKLLGKGDMLFYPQGYAKPARMQGAFISDKEVSDVVDFITNQTKGPSYSPEVEEKILSVSAASGASGADGASERDAYFVDAARFIMEKEKASIGMLQRAFKIGFNRAARIMDQLAEAGVVGEEEGTKPRKILMSPEQFEQYMEEYL